MKLQKNLACVFGFACGLPKRMILEKHAGSNSTTVIMSNPILKRARYCAYLRQFLMTTRMPLSQKDYNNAKANSNNSLKDENMKADAIIYVVENGILDITNVNKVYQYRQLNNEFVRMFRKYLTEDFVKNNYEFKVEYLIEIVDFNVSAKIIESFYSMFGGQCFNKNARLYPYSKILNMPPEKFRKLPAEVKNTYQHIYNDDKTLLNFIYALNGDSFKTSSVEEINYTSVEQMSYDEFISHENKKILFVDCENSNYYKILTFCNKEETKAAISRVILVNDSHIDNSQTDWNKLEEEISIPVEYNTVNRVVTEKSLVDGTLLLTIAKVYYQTNCDILIATSDSDFYILTNNLTGANICFLYEECKISQNFKALLTTKYSVIGQSLDDLTVGYEENIMPALVRNCIGMINYLISDQSDSMFNGALTANNVFDDDGHLKENLRKEMTKLRFKIEDNKLLVYAGNDCSVNG